MTPEEAMKIIKEAAGKIAEHFDAVQILATWHEDSLTHSAAAGCGNWYSRQGLAREFITRDIAQEHAHELGKVINDQEGE